MLFEDAAVEQMVADILGLYLNPPEHAAVFAVNERTTTQALNPLEPAMLLSPGRTVRHGFRYYRHGTLSMYAALGTRASKILGEAVALHWSEELNGLSTDRRLVRGQPGETRHGGRFLGRQDEDRRRALEQHPVESLHFTPTYSAWFNQVELWFGKIGRDLLARGISKPEADLARKNRRYIKQHNKDSKPICWVYSDPTRRTPTASADTVH